ncbi:hypothetical protein LM604_02290 [Candidatus Acetothermia bacterium]|nr:hypothetical protein [Candidatus Acetothermia bacterium]MCI2435836.1 hypothetical protein [Candidatus Acetothermia bacterium]
MTAQVATLRTPSEGLLTLLFPSPRRVRELLKQADTQQDFWSTLLKDPLVCKELERLAKAFKELARPLARAKSAAELEQGINAQLPAYLIWKGELFTLILKTLSETGPEAFLNEYVRAIQQIQDFFQEKATRDLDSENAERLKSALYGICLYSENLMRTILEKGPEAIDPDAFKVTIEDFFKADLLLMTATLIMIGEIKPWRWIVMPSELTKILALIAQRAEAHVDAIEDELMTRDLELRKLLEQPPGPSITLEEYSRQRGLS